MRLSGRALRRPPLWQVSTFRHGHESDCAALRGVNSQRLASKCLSFNVTQVMHD